MVDTPKIGETIITEPLSNDGNPSATPAVNVDAAEVERLKKEADQAKMEAAQARNEATKLRAEREAEQQAQLKEKEEFKTLYEQTQSRLDEITKAAEEKERQSELTAATSELFKDYPSNVVELAQAAGLSLSDDSDEAKAELKRKLDTFKEKVAPAPTVTPNNPSQPASAVTQEERTRQMSESRSSDGGGVQPGVISEYIKDLPAIKRMKEIARGA